MARKRKKAAAQTSRVIVPFSTFAPKGARLPKRFHAAVGRDAEGKPAWFLFDLIAFWELVCRIDERLFETLPDESYEKVTIGELIDALERQWPFNKKFREKIRQEYEKALRDAKAGRVRPL
ncbi:MAG: hypothetical protein AAB853_00555 [Patescibacteria group bacterium]